MSILPVYIPSLYNAFFLLFGRASFLGRMVFRRKLKLISPRHLPALQQLFSPHLFNLFKKILASPPFKIEGDYAFYMRDYKGETIKLLPFYMTDFLLTEL